MKISLNEKIRNQLVFIDYYFDIKFNYTYLFFKEIQLKDIRNEKFNLIQQIEENKNTIEELENIDINTNGGL